mgnify:CR=1 FL=1
MAKVLVVGAGGREHAIVRALARSPQVEAPGDLHAAPGNPGIAEDATVHDVAVDDVPGLVGLARELGVDLVAVGPEVPLVAGLVDALQEAGCEDGELLAHCRGPGPHVRGCWVVDLVLGKE